jgi:acetyl-CoA carboxylase biotin carboxyl carrier protein
MDKERIEAVIAIAEEHDLDALEVEDEHGAVRVVRRSPGVTVAGPVPAQNAAAAPRDPVPTGSAPLPEGVRPVPSPVVGVFSPASPPTSTEKGGAPLQPGDAVCAGQVLGFVEAMKMATEVVSPLDGVLAEVLAAEGQAVQFGDPLFLVRLPDGGE